MSAPAVEVHDLVKVYRPHHRDAVRAVDGICFSLDPGRIYGLLGPNGAGKTTLIKILSTLTLPTSGSARLLGVDVVGHPLAARRLLAAILQQHAVDVYLSVDANLVSYGRFHHLPLRVIRERMERVMALFGLGPYRNTKAVDLSVGFRRRLQVAKAFLSDSPLLFLDEMTTGMDPVIKRDCLRALREEVDRGRTVLLTTQNLQEAEELCDEIMIIDRGRIRAQGNLETIRNLASRLVTLRFAFAGPGEAAIEHLRSLSPTRLEVRNGSVRVTLRGEGIRPLDVLNEVHARSPLTEFEVSRPSLEDIFLEFVGEPQAPASQETEP